MRKRIAVAVTLLLAVAGALFASFYRPPNEPWRPADLVRSTVLIEVGLPSDLSAKERLRGIGCTGTGSGALIDQDLILTAKHVAEPRTSSNCLYPALGYDLIYRVYFASEPDQRLSTYGCRAEPVASSAEHDIAILQIKNLSDCIDSFTGKVMPTPLRFADSDAVQMGDPVYSFGFPARAMGANPAEGRDSSDPAVAIWGSGTIASVRYTTMPKDTFITTLHASAGGSGGPVLNSVGAIVGVVTAVDYLNNPSPGDCGAMPTGNGAVPPPAQDLNGDGRWQPWEWCPTTGSSWTYATPVAWIFDKLYCLRRETLLPPTVARKYDCIAN